jgi:sugar (pentulose or hexulose) kinase
MNFIMENIGNILLCLGGLIVLANAGGGGGQTEAEIADQFWQQNSVNPNSHNYEGI